MTPEEEGGPPPRAAGCEQDRGSLEATSQQETRDKCTPDFNIQNVFSNRYWMYVSAGLGPTIVHSNVVNSVALYKCTHLIIDQILYQGSFV